LPGQELLGGWLSSDGPMLDGGGWLSSGSPVLLDGGGSLLGSDGSHAPGCE
jgi:hypothetical protein